MGYLLRMRSSLSVSVASVAAAACFATALLVQSGATQAQPAAAELVIRNGLIVNENGRMAADIRISGEKIVEIAPKLQASPGAKVIDATGMLLLPGAIDTHTHLELAPLANPRFGDKIDDWTTGSMAALAGGVTTISNFIPMASNEDPNAFADRVIKSLETYAIADVYPRALVRPTSTPKGAPPDPLTQNEDL